MPSPVTFPHKALSLSPEVSAALSAGRPVVALETTVLSHGMPWPDNLDTARALEADVRATGAIPATIAIMDGQIRVGIGEKEMMRLARGEEKVWKLSRRDLPVALATGAVGATTVAGTMIVAALAGIRVFATGGIGGVHRGAETSFDISADLEELARSPVCVVCAGAKAILDLPKTLEVLETRGVPVLGFGCDEFPAFYSHRSGLSVDYRVDDAGAVARILRAKWDLGLEGGVLVANPVPLANAADPDAMEQAIQSALAKAATQGIHGRDLTPYLLQTLEEITEGRSLITNIALIRNNAVVAAKIAVALSQI